MAPKYTPIIGNYPAYNYLHNLPGTLRSLKGFKCMFTVTDHEANDIPKTRAPEKEQRG